MRSIKKIQLKASLILSLALVSLTPQKSLAIELIPILDQVGKQAVEGAIKGFFGMENDQALYDEEDDVDEYEEDEEYEEEYEEYNDSDDSDEYVEVGYNQEAFSQNYPGYRYAPYPPMAPMAPMAPAPGYGYYPYPQPGYMMPPQSYPSYPVYAPGYPASPPAYAPGYSESYVPNLPNSSTPAFVTNW